MKKTKETLGNRRDGSQKSRLEYQQVIGSVCNSLTSPFLERNAIPFTALEELIQCCSAEQAVCVSKADTFRDSSNKIHRYEQQGNTSITLEASIYLLRTPRFMKYYRTFRTYL